MKPSVSGAWSMAAAVLLAAVLGGCTITSSSRAPVEDRIGGSRAPAPRVDPSTRPGFEHAGTPGYFTVRAGDTVRRIAAEVGQSWSDIAAWNNLQNPDLIEIGQVLRVVPPTGASAAAPVAPATPAAASSEPVPVATQTTPGVAAAAQPAASAAAAPQPLAAGNIRFAWPASGAVLKKFDGDTNKGLSIGGKAGDPVLAAADGKVVYAGSGLSGYGNLIILKHDDTYLTAYAHNRALLVKENQDVRKGQKIAEMGATDADRVNLHFEIRRSGQPVDPAKYLPAR